MRTILPFASVVVLSLLSFNSLVSQTATTSIDVNTAVMPNPKLLLGITYDCRSSMSISGYGLAGYHNTNATSISGIDSVFHDFPLSTLRYPANGIAGGFQWKKSIGAVNTRPGVKLFGGSTPAQKMEFGFDEFMQMTTSRGVDPKDIQIMVPIYDSTDANLTATQTTAAIPNMIQSNADWVEYANSPNDGTNPGGGTDWAALRAANGHPLPYGIKIWNMGNEPYTPNEYTGTGASSYIAKIVPIIDGMLAIDPTIQISVTVIGRLITPGGNYPNGNWTYEVLNSPLLQNRIYALSCHYFMTEDVVGGNIPQGVSVVSGALSTLAAATQAKGYKLFVGDQAHYITSTSPTQAEQDLAMQWQGANLAADMLLAMSQIQNVERSNFWVYGLTSAVWHPIRRNTNGTYTLMPVASMYKTLSPLFLDNSVTTLNTSPVASDGNPYSVRCGAFASNNLSSLNVIAVNRDKINTIPLQVNGVSGYSLTSARILTGTDLTAEVIDENPIVADGNGNYQMPPMSVLILEYTNTLVGIDNLGNESNQTVIFPNPFTTYTILRTDNILKNATITLYNFCGQTVRQLNNISGYEILLHRDNLPTGVYFLQLKQGSEETVIRKLIVTN